MLILQNQDTHMLFYKSKIYIMKLNLFPDCHLPACDLTKCQSILQNYYFVLMILVKVQIMQNAQKKSKEFNPNSRRCILGMHESQKHTHTHFRILVNPGPIPVSWKTRLKLVTSILPITITLTVNCVLKSRDSYASYIVGK